MSYRYELFSYLYGMKQWILVLCLFCTHPEGVTDVAKRYIGTPYVAGTLEMGDEEQLVIDEQRMDCTTFVELSVAHWLSMRNDSLTFEQQVQALRYRNGVIDGYLSRLHYFTDWVAENAHRGIWHEVKPEGDSLVWQVDTLTLSFMSKHPDSYAYLKAHASAVDSMRTIEQRYAAYPIHYIRKEYLDLPPEKLPIRNGDILGLVTTIDGLDVTHLGFAVWQDKRLHLMHASMQHGKVVIDERSLYDYLKDRNSSPGVRVVRMGRTTNDQ